MNAPDTFSRTLNLLFGLSFATLFLVGVAAFFPTGRIWGVNVWAYQPWFVPTAAILAAALLSVWLRFHASKTAGGPPKQSAAPGKHYRVIGVLSVLILGLLFWFFRTRTHFLGDGYQIISHLHADDPSFAKTFELGEAYFHLLLYKLLGGGREAALLSYRLLSVTAGLLATAVSLLIAARLFRDLPRRLLFAGGVLSGGYALLFFGYVEHYSLFVCAVLVFTLTGLLAVRGEIGRWVPVLAMLLAVALHVLGVALVPAAAYLMFVGRLNSKTSRLAAAAVSGVVVLAGVVVFYHFYSTNLFFKFAFVPLVPIEITVAGYTLFSLSHLADFLNLLFLLLPALPLLLFIVAKLPWRTMWQSRGTRFLAATSISSLGAVFLLDPKLGMPRDWDLFSFAGVPLVVLFYYLVLKVVERERSMRWGIYAAGLGIILGVTVVSGRVAAQTEADTAIAHLRNYMELDRAKNRAAVQLLREHYNRTGNIIASLEEIERWKRDYPEVQLGLRAKKLIEAGRASEALPLCRRAIRMNPLYWSGYTSLGSCFIDQERWDSAQAVLEIANGINPNNPTILHNLGYSLMWQQEFERAEELFRRAIRLDSGMTRAYQHLAGVYVTTGQTEPLEAVLEVAQRREDVSVEWQTKIADYYLTQGQPAKAAELYRRVLRDGFDTAAVRQRIEEHPELREHLSLPHAAESK